MHRSSADVQDARTEPLMPRYFFHSEDGFLVHDDSGTDLADQAAARIEAVRLCGCLLTERPQTLWESTRLRHLVTDSAGMILFTIEVSTAVGATVIPWRRTSPA